jgi:hypothetical protein
VPYGATIDKIEALILNNDTGSGTNMLLGRIGPANFTTPAAPAVNSVGSVNSPATVAVHKLTLDVNELAVDTSVSQWFVQFTGSSAATGDKVYAVRVVFLDPGPRNF